MEEDYISKIKTLTTSRLSCQNRYLTRIKYVLPQREKQHIHKLTVKYILGVTREYRVFKRVPL